MPSLRDEITRTFLRLGRKGSSTSHPGPAGGAKPSGLLVEGTVLGSYRILKQLGSGGMGHVYLALDTHLNRKVALKLLPPELTANPVFLRRFQQEAKTASALNHPNILTIFEFPEISGRHIIVSEFVEGQTLRALLNKKIEIQHSLDIISQIASALSAAHAAGVIHRDLKPTNIMIRPDGYVKVIDFGLAKLTQHRADGFTENEPWTQPGSVLGTVGYMSPEQAKGEETDARSDIWSIGVILYEMVARRRPFQGITDSHVIVAILDEPPRPFPETEELPAGLPAIIHRALAKDKNARYQNAQELFIDVRRVQAAMGTAIPQLKLPPRKRRFPYVLLSSVLTLVAAGFALWWWAFGGEWTVLGPTWLEFGASRRLTFRGNVRLATISPNGKLLAYVAGSAGNETCRILELQTNTEKQLPTAIHAYLGLTFSPDSNTLFYVLKDRQQEHGRLFSIPVAGIGSDPPSVILEDLEGPVALSPKGDRFVFVRGRAEGNQDVNRIFMGLETNPRNVYPVVALSGTQINLRLAWSPHNDWFAAITYPSRLHQTTRPAVSLFRPDGRPFKNFSPGTLRRLEDPVPLDGGSFLVFAGMPEGAEQNQLVQLFAPTGEFHSGGSETFGFASLSATADSQKLAAVRSDERASIWTVDADSLQSPRELTPEWEKLSSLDWLEDGSVVFPSTRAGSVNLVKLQADGEVGLLAKAQACVQSEPAAVPGERSVVYASNCAHGGDDFNLWALDLADGKQRRLTSGSNYDNEPNVSPDGAWVYYTSWSSNIPSIWKVAVGGGMPIRVSQTQAHTPVVSPDGTKFVSTVREDHGRWDVAILSSSDGSIVNRLPQIPINRPIRWSPDGTALDYVNEDKVSFGIWRQPLPIGSPLLLLRVSEGTIPSFSWNRTGTKLAYIRARDQKDAVLFARAPSKQQTRSR
jgi:Tol biopolymer transport system component